MKRYFIFTAILWAILLQSCEQQSETHSSDQEINYADAACWYNGNALTSDKQTDIFYIVPTCIWDYTDSNGVSHHHMDIFNKEQRALVNPSIELAKRVLSDSCNFYAPYYRQISMDSWLTLDTALIEQRFELAYHDVVEAFRYYMHHYNNGRPFILAGHSQGAKAIIELLKHELTEATYQQLVAAYAIGYTISSEEVNAYPFLRPAQHATDIGVTIHFNSVTRPDAVSPLFAENKVCINPINWTTDATPAQSYQGFTATIDTAIHTIIVQGVDEAAYYIPSVATLLPKGNLHVYEFNLYENDLRNNVSQRIKAYFDKHTTNVPALYEQEIR